MTRIPHLTAALCLALCRLDTLGAGSTTARPGRSIRKSPARRPPCSPAGVSGASKQCSRHSNGVKDVVSGFSGGSKTGANYNVVSTGTTGHAESVKITYDPAKISYGQLLKIFFQVAHDPTQLNRQGPDEGPQYRSAIFFSTPEQKAVAEAYISQLNDAHVFPRRIVTTVSTLDGFYPAEAEHQDFIVRNPTNPYVLANDRPKIEQLQKDFPQLLKTR